MWNVTEEMWKETRRYDEKGWKKVIIRIEGRK